MLMLVLMTLMQGHSGSANAKDQQCMLSATKQAISIKLAIGRPLFTWPWVGFCKSLYGLTIFGHIRGLNGFRLFVQIQSLYICPLTRRIIGAFPGCLPAQPIVVHKNIGQLCLGLVLQVSAQRKVPVPWLCFCSEGQGGCSGAGGNLVHCQGWADWTGESPCARQMWPGRASQNESLALILSEI